MKKTTRKGIIRKLDAITRDIVLTRDNGCVTCPIQKKIKRNWKGGSQRQAGHLFSRVAYSTRWNLKNVFEQCNFCNRLHEYDPFPLSEYFIKKFGMEEYEKLHMEYVTPRKFKDFELAELYQELESITRKVGVQFINDEFIAPLWSGRQRIKMKSSK